jgi:hypothetical protein
LEIIERMFWLLPITLQHGIRFLKGAGRRALAYERLMIFIKLQREGDGCAQRPIGDASSFSFFSSAGTSPSDDQSDSDIGKPFHHYLSTVDK